MYTLNAAQMIVQSLMTMALAAVGIVIVSVLVLAFMDFLRDPKGFFIEADGEEARPQVQTEVCARERFRLIRNDDLDEVYDQYKDPNFPMTQEKEAV